MHWDHVAWLRDLEAETQRLANSAHSDAEQIGMLRRNLTQLALMNAALWELVKKQGGYTDGDLKKAMEEVIARGVPVAGAAVPEEVRCAACAHKISPTVTRCVYCGAGVRAVG